tara:strand:+ start:166 stop:957 length:792 start_codon:yes stop_codon:yes gene_type:complete
MSRTLTVPVAFLIVILSVFSALIIASIFSAMDPSILDGTTPSLSTYISMFVGQSFLIVPVLIYLNKKGAPIFESLRLKIISKKTAIATLILSLGAMVISDEINILVDKIIPAPESFLQLEAMLTPENPLSMIILIITIVILAPVGEELLFRGFLQKFLENQWGDVTKAILISSLFFAAIHFNPYWLIQIYFLGVLLGYIAWKTSSVIPAIIFHVFINGSSLLFTHLGESIESILLWNGHVNPLILILGGYCFFIGMKQIQGIS